MVVFNRAGILRSHLRNGSRFAQHSTITAGHTSSCYTGSFRYVFRQITSLPRAAIIPVLTTYRLYGYTLIVSNYIFLINALTLSSTFVAPQLQFMPVE